MREISIPVKGMGPVVSVPITVLRKDSRGISSEEFMPLRTGMASAEMDEYLRRDLFVSVDNDVGPCTNPGRPGGGYFAVPRLVLGYVDYLGAPYNGYTGRRDARGRRIFADGRYARRFLQEVDRL